MKVTEFGRPPPTLIIGTISNSLSVGGVTATAAGTLSSSSNTLPVVGNIPVATASNTFVWRDALSFGSNTNDVSSIGTMGASASNTRADHVHRGVHSVAHTSNTLYGDVILTASGIIGITSPTPGTLNFSASGGSGGSGGGAITTKDEGVTLSTVVTTLDFVGSGVTASGAGATTTVTVRGLGQTSGTLLRTYTFDTTVENWTADVGTLTSTAGRLRFDRSGGANGSALEPSSAANVADGEFQCDLFSVSGTDLGLIFRATDASNHYMLAVRLMGSAGGNLQLYKKVGGSYTSLGVVAVQLLSVGATCKMLVRFVGSEIDLYFNEAFHGGWSDGTYTTGRIGIRADTAIMEIDNVKVYSIP